MSHSPELSALVQRFVDDRDGLTDHEYELLVAAVRQSPDLAAQIRDQLVMDDALSQHLAIDRRDFHAQVQQRVSDHLRGEDELNQQADELRSLALARLDNAALDSRMSWSTWTTWGVALSLILAVGWGVWKWEQSQRDSLLAKVEDVVGQVVVHRFPKGNDEYARNGLSLRAGDSLSVADNANLTLTWSDGTRAQLTGGTVVTLPASVLGKRIYVDRGNVAAIVARQPAGKPMVFATPHADAIVRGTELYLHVRANDTRLDVAEGKVELIEHTTRDTQIVESSESANATVGTKVAKDSIRWPTSRQGLVYLFAGGQRPPLVRSKSLLQPTRLTPVNPGAAFNERGEMELSGGRFEDYSAGADVASHLRTSGQFTIEAVVAAGLADDNHIGTIFALQHEQQTTFALRQRGLNQIEVVLPSTSSEFFRFSHRGAADQRTHFMITFDGDELTLYVDGAEVQRLPCSASLASMAGSQLAFGGEQPDHWQGRIAGLAIYDRALTNADHR